MTVLEAERPVVELRLARYRPLLIVSALLSVAAVSVLSVSAIRPVVGLGPVLGGWDAQFYYAAARSLVFDGDLDVTNDLPGLPAVRNFDADGDGVLELAPRRPSGQVLNKYPIGLSIVAAPGIALAHGARWLWETMGGTASSREAGYSEFELHFVAVLLVAITLGGLLLLYLMAARIAPPHWAAAAVLLTWVGTPLLYYTAVVPFMAHGVALALVAALLYQAWRLERGDSPTLGKYASMAATGGLLFLVRPQQVLLIPLLAPILVPSLLRYRKSRIVALLVPALIFGSVCTVQLLVNHSQTGTWTLNAYAAGGEGFDWRNPQLATVLISGDRGLLWISPIVLIAAAAFLRRRPGTGVLPWIIAAHGLLQIYVIACWSSPEQGDSFGARMWIECLPFVSFGLALLWSGASRVGSIALAAAALVCAMWTTSLLAMKRELAGSHVEIIQRVWGKALTTISWAGPDDRIAAIEET